MKACEMQETLAGKRFGVCIGGKRWVGRRKTEMGGRERAENVRSGSNCRM